MAFGSRGKGSKAELAVAALLQAWWRQVEPECLFCRVPGSGGWRQPEHRESFNLSGDLMCDALSFPFALEVKRREEWTWRTIELGSRSPAWAWWRQAIGAAREANKHPMLWMKKNSRHVYDRELGKLRVADEPWLVFIPHELDGRIPQAIRAKKVWVPAELVRVDYGSVLPVCYEAAQLLRAPAKLFVPLAAA